MRVMTIEQAADFLRTEFGMDVSHDWVRKMAEPDADGRRRLPIFRLTPGKTATLYTTDIALETHFLKLTEAALAELHGGAVFGADLVHPQNRPLSQKKEKQGLNANQAAPKIAGWKR